MEVIKEYKGRVLVMMRSICLIVFGVFSLCQFASFATAETLSGRLTDTSGAPVQNFTVQINKDVIKGRDGVFTLDVEQTELVSLQFSAPGYFPITQTFSLLELNRKEEGHALPPVQLVARKPGRVMLAFGGDVMMGRRYSSPRGDETVLIRPDHKAEDTKAIVRHVKPYFDGADYGSVNLETQVMSARPKGSASKLVTFFSPPETTTALAWAGVDYVTLGNNHTYDNLEEGLVATLDILNASPLAFSGAGLTEKAALAAHRIDISDMPYSFLGYVGWKGGGQPHQAAEGDHKGGAALGSMENIIRSVGAEVAEGRTTVVQYHGSLEYGEEPTLLTEQRLKSAIDQGADLAIAHHPHVVQGFEIYKDRLIAYSLGNFIFDQYFYGPQFSYMLYVWMDGEKFHRAEIVPVYIKGYVPTPATGPVRRAILSRTAELSDRRGVSLGYSGGHGVITTGSASPGASVARNISLDLMAGKEKVISLGHCTAGVYATGVEAQDTGLSYRFGQEMLRRGDFESFDHFDAPERGWIIEDPASGLSRDDAYQGVKSFKLSGATGKKTATFGMKVFTRLYRPATPSSLIGQVRADQDVTVKVYFQGRPTRGKLGDSLENAPKKLLGSLKVAKGDWRRLSVEYNSPRVGYRSYRLLLDVEHEGGRDLPDVYFDNIGLVEWRTAYQSADGAGHVKFPNQYTHLAVRAGQQDVNQVLIHEYHDDPAREEDVTGRCQNGTAAR